MSGEEAPFGERLRRLREGAGLTQEGLASRAGLTAKAVSALERGERKRPYPHTVRSLSDALGLPEEDRLSLPASVQKRGEPSPAAPFPALPVPPTPLLGRGRELAEIGGFLEGQGPRLLTLTGPGVGGGHGRGTRDVLRRGRILRLRRRRSGTLVAQGPPLSTSSAAP
jgi:transcriptional regulator with XRE-family HTH domain